MPVPPWTLIATDAQIARLAGLTLALACTVDDAPAVAVMGIRGGRSVRGRAARCHVTVAQLGARGRPRRLRIPAWLRLNDFVREYASGAVLEKALVVPGARWGTAALFGRGTTTEVARDGGSVFDASQIVARLTLKGARLARRATSDGEREAALAQVQRLLESLALYYLPAPEDVPGMVGSMPELGARQ